MSADIPDLPDVRKMHSELVELRAAFLVNTSKLGMICAAFGVDATLHFGEPDPAFESAVREKIAEHWQAIRRMQAEINLLKTQETF